MNTTTIPHSQTAKLMYLIVLSLSLSLLLNATPANAACPGGDPCATSSFYRIQSWPMPLEDAGGRSILSLKEANATDLDAFEAVIGSMGTSSALAIRFDVTRITIAPQNYCECNFELNDKGCHGGMAAGTLLQCERKCRRGGNACTGSGNFAKQSGGHWYSFPASTAMGPGGAWKKNAFEVKPQNRDWRENSSTIKRASCIATALASEDNQMSIDDLFDNAEPCPVVPMGTLTTEATPRAG